MDGERPESSRIMAPEDCTEAEGLRRLLVEVRSRLRTGVRDLVVDLSGVRLMNARLLATVLLMSREVRRAGGNLKLTGATDDFQKWAQIFGVFGPLQRRGVL